MIAYEYNDKMKYIGTTQCQKDPVRSEKEARDVWLLPASATFVSPPNFDRASHKAVWDGASWQVEALPIPEPEPEPDPEPTVEDRLDELEAALAQTDETAIELYEANEDQIQINAAQDEALIEIYEMLEG